MRAIDLRSKIRQERVEFAALLFAAFGAGMVFALTLVAIIDHFARVHH